MLKRSLVAVAAATVVLLGACSSPAPSGGDTDGENEATNYPERPISLIVPVPAGSSTDISTRFVVPCLEQELGGTIVVENREGGGGAVGNGLFVRADADGYTLVSTAIGNAAVTPLKEDNVGYDASSFEPIGMVGSSPVTLVVRADSPYETAEQLLEKSESERIVVGIPGPTSVPGISLSALTDLFDLQLEGVPFTGNGNTIAALINGEAEAAYLSADGGVVLPRIQSGEIRALAVAIPEERDSLPGVPTLESLGYEGLPNGDSFWFMATQVGTPEPIVEKLEGAMEVCMSDPEIQSQIGEGVAPATFVDGATTRDMLLATAESYAEFLK